MAAQPEYRAGAAASGHVTAVVLEDRRGARAIFAETDFPITRAVSDFVAVQLVKRYEVDRAAIVISGAGPATPDPIAVIAAIEQAIARVDDASLSFAGAISVKHADGTCVATLYPIQLQGCRSGDPVHGPIRAAFHMIDVPHPLQSREAQAAAYPVQAVAIGKPVILALGGDVPTARYQAPFRIVVPHANDTAPVPANVIDAAVANVLKRVR